MPGDASSGDMFILPDTDFKPLAEKMRPERLEHYFGQSHIVGENKPLRDAILSDRLHSMIFWGPPGTGKTTLARLIATQTGAHFHSLSAVLAGVKDIRDAVTVARRMKSEQGRQTILFIDEVHRFNKSQQDAFLPHVEDGTFVFVGATTENPSFELNNALLSRARIYKLQSLGLDELLAILQFAMQSEDKGLAGQDLQITDKDLRLIAVAADGDARRALNMLEIVADLAEDGKISRDKLLEVVSGNQRRFDQGGDLFYEQISALHKSVRGSSPDASLYWLARMLDGGCDPLYIARRVVRMASEDIGNADPRALGIALDAWETQQRLGSPEGHLAIAQAVVYLACAAKSNAVYMAFKAAEADVRSGGSYDVPVHLRNAPTKMMKELGYGRAYRYAHDEPEAYAAGETYFPDEMGERRYYQPVNRGMEIKIAEKLDWLKSLDDKAKK
jgi:putative ATPase